MSKKTNSHSVKPRKSAYLSKYYADLIDELLKPFENPQRIELAQHFQRTFREVASYFDTRNSEIYTKFVIREEAVRKKYGKAYQGIARANLYGLFDFNLLLTETDYYTTEEFNALIDQEAQLSKSDVDEWTQAMGNFLYWKIHYYQLEQEPDFTVKIEGLEEIDDISISKEPINQEQNKNLGDNNDIEDSEMTDARQLLALYFFLKATLGAERYASIEASKIAKFAHLLKGKKFTSLQNSNLYNKYRQMPEYNKGTYQIHDLKYIRPYLDALGISEALNLIDKQIDRAIDELPAIERKKYRPK